MAERRIGKYRLARRVRVGDPARGLPDLWLAEDAGDTYYAKLWIRKGDDRGDIRALWNREVRGLTRLQGYPGAGELFVRLQDLDLNDQYYYAILDGGHRMPLSEILQRRNSHPWLLNLAEVGRRRPIWEGLLRIAEALSILHGEGTLHRTLSTASVFVSPEGQGDFRLSGFEWSLRISGREGAAAKVGPRTIIQAPELERPEGEYSTATDWFDFGVLTAEIFGASSRVGGKRSSLRSAVADLSTLRGSERELILALLDDDIDRRISSAEFATQALRNIVRDLSVATAAPNRALVLAIRLNSAMDLPRIVAESSEGAAPINDPVRQLDWIRHDLRGDIRITARTSPFQHFILKGERLEYRVRPWTAGSLLTWDIGFCEQVEFSPRTNPDDQYFDLGARALDIRLFPTVKNNFKTTRDRSAPWDRVFAFRQTRPKLAPYLRDVHDFFRVTQQLDTALTVAQICPVDVLSVDRSSSYTEVVVTPREEADRNELAQHLRLSRPSEQLADWFDLGAEALIADDEDDPKRDRYQLLDRRTLGSEYSRTAAWKFIDAKRDPGGPRYRFRCQEVASVREGRVYLARNHGGTLKQIRRRHKAIEDLKSHEGLLRMLAEPSAVSRESGDDLPPERETIPLDESKLRALGRLWKRQPSFAIQGPPGTGKTTLIKAFADRYLDYDPSAQILVSAHSHHTVDDVRNKLAGLFDSQSAGERPILVRLGANLPTNQDLEPVTDELLIGFCSSTIARRAPEALRNRLDALMRKKKGGDDEDAEVDVKTMRLLVQDAANITFTTSNSAELAELAARGRRFDWSIIEEAGKAHGFDMAAALQESHRLLLIGDHFQLPPFNAERFTQLLGEPLRVRLSIQAAASFAPGLIDSSVVEDADDQDPLDIRCALWRRMVMLFGTIFERSLGEDPDQAPAATLTDQHRMHPDIAQIVGKIFYPDNQAPSGTLLHSPDETHKKFEGDAPYTHAENSWMPLERVVWCDVEWKQKKEFAEGEVEGLFVSRPEVATVISVLDQLCPRDGIACELQILSPYNDQLGAIRSGIEAARRAGRLSHMFGPTFDLGMNKRIGATVDEFQGSEADIVIVSLVRNNALVPWKSVGFLKEATRMNVLLSRARHKLIIVGSWDFFSSRCDAHTSPDDAHSYLGRMMTILEQGRRGGRVARISEKGRV